MINVIFRNNSYQNYTQYAWNSKTFDNITSILKTKKGLSVYPEHKLYPLHTSSLK